MRRRYCTITPSLVRSLAHAALRRALPWRGHGRLVSADALVDVLLRVAALGSSLFAVVRRFAFGFCHQTARQAVRANLPGLGELTEGLADALFAFADRSWRRRRWDLAADRHYAPFYGGRRTPRGVGRPPQQGTRDFHAYATA